MIKQWFYQVCFAVLALALVGCSTFQAVGEALTDNELIAGVIAYKATSELIQESDDPQGRAERIILYTDAVMDILDNDSRGTLDTVYQSVYELIDWESIPEVDHRLIEDLLIAVRDKLAEEAEDFAILTPETRVSLQHIVARIRDAADYHLI